MQEQSVLSKNATQRNENIDFLRCLAAFAVVVIHIISGPMVQCNHAIVDSVENTLNTICALQRWSVPVFFMITGYCMQLRATCDYPYIFLKEKKYILVLCTIGLMYSLTERVFYTHELNLRTVLEAFVDILNGRCWAHMWYIYAMLGTYLLIPVTFHYMKNCKDGTCFIILLFAFTIFIPWMQKYDFGIKNLNIYFPFGGFAFYVSFGQYCAVKLANKTIREKYRIGIVLTAILFLIASAILTCHTLPKDSNDLAVCGMAVGIFALCIAVPMRISHIISKYAKYTFGIYLVHPIFINAATKGLNMDFLSGMVYLKLLIFLAIDIGLSFICTYICKKIPIARYLF